MPTARAERRALPRLVAVALVGVLTLTGCASGSGPGGAAPQSTSSARQPGQAARSGGGDAPASDGVPSLQGMPVPRDLAKAFTGLLDRRAAALMAGDRAAFVAGLDAEKPAFVVAQNGYFDNLAQLPVAQLSYTLDQASLVRGSAGYQVVVAMTFQLDGYDALPATSYRRFRFTRVAGGRYRLSSVTDPAWQQANDVVLQPWEQRPVQVRSGAGVLAVFDDQSVSAAGPLVRSLENSVADVAARVPYDWDRRVVVYALSDLSFLEGLDNLPGEDPDALDGVAFTVPAGPGDPRVADTRVALNPRLLTRAGAARDRLLRHELTHVAVAEHDDYAPTWLSEGIAEWVSVQALAPQDRQVSDDALAEAKAEAEAGVVRMPVTATFNDTDSDLHYAVAWWSCEYLADTYGPSAPWQVLDAFAVAGADERATVKGLLQLSVDALARRGTKRLIEAYDPAFYAPEDVSPSTSAVPSDGASPTG